jgi:hypothetical protein
MESINAESPRLTARAASLVFQGADKWFRT